MKLITRRILYITTACVFLIVAPIVIFYAIGYRLDLSNRQVAHTGGMYIRTYPASSQIYLDNKLVASRTPARIKFLMPKTYQVTIEQPGYRTIQTNIEVKSGQVALLDPLELYPTDYKQLDTINKVSGVFPSPYTQSAVVVTRTENSFYVMLVKNNSRVEIGDIDNNPETIKWKNASDDFIMQTGNGSYVYQSKTKKIIGPFQSVDSLYFGFEDSTYFENVDGITTKIITEGGTVTSSENNAQFEYTQDNKKFTFEEKNGVTVVSVTASATKTKLGELSVINDVQYIKKDLLLLQTRSGCYLLRTSDNRLFFLDDQLESWNIKDAALWFSNGFELWKVDLNSLDKSLLSRFSSPIDSFGLSRYNSALFVTFPEEIQIWYLTAQTPTVIKLPKQALEHIKYSGTGSNETIVYQIQSEQLLIGSL